MRWPRRRLFFSAMCWEMWQSRLETRGPLRDTCATSYSRIQSRRKWKQLAWPCVHSRTQKTCVHTHTHGHICLFERQGRRDSVDFNRWLPCLGQRPSLDSKLTTAARAERNERQSTKSPSSMYIDKIWGKIVLASHWALEINYLNHLAATEMIIYHLL